MFQLRILLSIIICCISSAKVMGQEIRAELQSTHKGEDSLIITLTLRSTMDKSVYLICPVNSLIYNDYIPIRANYGSFKAEVKARKKNQTIVRQGHIEDSIKLVMPITKERFQKDSKGNEMDVFKTLSNLNEVFNNRKIGWKTPIPPDNDSVFFIDTDLYKLIMLEDILTTDDVYVFREQTVLLGAGEEKSFNIDLGYLLLRKATYLIKFDYKTDNNYLEKETNFLKSLGFHPFRGRITSNVLEIKSK